MHSAVLTRGSNRDTIDDKMMNDLRYNMTAKYTRCPRDPRASGVLCQGSDGVCGAVGLTR